MHHSAKVPEAHRRSSEPGPVSRAEREDGPGGGHSGATYTAYEALNQGAALGIMLPFNRGQESEADVVGLEYMARAGFDPRQAVDLWQNMSAENKNEPAEFMSTHPSSERRIEQLISEWPNVLPLYNAALDEGKRPDCKAPPRNK